MAASKPSNQPTGIPLGLTPLELAQELLAKIEQARLYARSRKSQFRLRSSAVRLLSLALMVASTVILGLQDLEFWAGLGFALVAVATVVNTLEPFFAWRSRWVLLEESHYRFCRLRDELKFYIASTQAGQLDPATIKSLFDDYQVIWDQQSTRWLESRRSAGSLQGS
jgi:hypothetical protein